jgi:hypothetical protein
MSERPPGFEAVFLDALSAMPAEQQVVLLAAWLQEINPGFDGKLTHKAEGGVVTSLDVPSPFVQDLTPLRALTGLRAITCRGTVGYDNKADSDAAALRPLKALETINGKPVAQFWKEIDTRRAEFREWLRAVPALTAEQQVTAVVAKLKAHNPGFDGQLEHKIERGVVTELSFGNAADLSPVRALAGLKALTCSGPLADLSPLKGLKLGSLTVRSHALRDLSPLTGMPLTSLDLALCIRIQDLGPLRGMPLASLDVGGWVGQNAGVRDLSPLKGMPLASLNLRCCPVEDLGPLRGMPLTSLELGLTPVRDLSPLRGMKLASLSLHNCTRLVDLTPIKGMPLTSLNLGGWMAVPVRDLAPLEDMPLKTLAIEATAVTDLRPLRGMRLEEMTLTPKTVAQGLDVLRDMKSLKAIGTRSAAVGEGQTWPAAGFWFRYDRGEFK